VTRTVLSVAYPFAPVTADSVGGAEQVLALIDRALVTAGWRSIVLACEGSAVAGELVTVPAPAGVIDDMEWSRGHVVMRRVLGELMRRERIDLIHMHGLDFDRYLPPPGAPTVVTLHLPMDWYLASAFRPPRPDTWLVPVSRDQAGRAPAHADLLAPIGNGVEVDVYPRVRKRGYALTLGRICPEKGFHLAVDAAKAADAPLLMAGQLFPYSDHTIYFDGELKPRLDRRRRWLGPVTGAPKRRLLAAARCLLVTSLIPETASLVAMEALAAGTPVIALRDGALPEVVDHGVTGFLVRDVNEMAEAIRQADRIDPDACRRAARERFSVERMTGAYLDLYGRLLAGEASHVRRRAAE
jgi:glycosyltransferase involved in cell wall biosynthesis